MRFLVLGLGSIGSRHARNLKDLGHEVLAFDPKYHDDDWAGSTFYEDIKIIKDPRDETFDGCVIATPTIEHDNDLMYAIARKWPSFVEKPLADRVTSELIASIDLAKMLGVPVMMGNNLRFHPSARLAKRYIADNLIGNPIWAHICCAQFNDKEAYRRDGVTLNWGSHEIDLALWLFGPAVVKTAAIDEDDLLADICLLHTNGCQSVIHLDYLTQPELRQSVIMGDKGRMVMSLIGRYIAIQRGMFSKAPEKQDGDYDEDYQREMIAFVNAIEGKPWPGATGEDGLAALKIIDAARGMAK